MPSPWTPAHIPDQTGRVAIVTGGNSGIGFECARELARKGAHVVLACRDAGKAAVAVDALRKEMPAASVEAADLDLARLDSVRQFAASASKRHPQLHILLNNAGVMAIPRRETADGFEMQLGTNHLGHFALTGLLLPQLLATPGARVVNVSSTAHRSGQIRFDDLQSQRSYGKWRAYGQSKLANLLFTYELQRRLETAAAGVSALASHPGYAATNLQAVGPRMSGSRLMERVMEGMNRAFSQDAAGGALPSLYAATCPEARGGSYIGPSSFAEVWGPPKVVQSSRRSHSLEDAARLFAESEELTGVRFALAG